MFLRYFKGSADDVPGRANDRQVVNRTGGCEVHVVQHLQGFQYLPQFEHVAFRRGRYPKVFGRGHGYFQRAPVQLDLTAELYCRSRCQVSPIPGCMGIAREIDIDDGFRRDITYLHR